MRLKSLLTTAASVTTNQRLKTCVAHILMLCLLSSEVWSYANIKYGRSVRQSNTEKSVNYEDSSMTNLHHQPHFTRNRSVIVQLFEWKFLDVAAECRNFLGPQGYAGVQLSPVLEHTVIKTSSLNHPWWERYEVISYRLSSRSGDESEFWSMSRICNDHGVRIYADVVLNHMAAPLHFVAGVDVIDKDFIVNTTLETNVNISQLNYSNVSYTQVDFHRPVCVVLDNAQDAHEIRNCQLNGHPDLDHSRGGVQQHIVEMLNKFIDMGVAGFRIDTAKYIWPIDLKIIFQQVKNLNTEFNFEKNSRPFIYQDIFDLGLDTVSKTEYSTYGVVSEYLYPAELATIINGKVSLSSLINWGPALGFLPHEDSLVFIDSHDTQRGLPQQLGSNRFLTHKQRIKYIMANVFMLVHPYGAVKRIMSSYYFPDAGINQGPPIMAGDDEEIRSPQFNEQQQCTKEFGWVCEHRWPELVSVLKVANYFKVPGQEETSVIYFQTNGPNQVAFCRGYKAFIAINNDNELDFEKEVYACLQPGTYCDMVTGGKKQGEKECHGKTLIINEQGYTKLQISVADGNSVEYEEENQGEEENEEETGRIENYGILVIYIESKIQTRKYVNINDGTEENPIEADGHGIEIKKEGSEAENDNKEDEADENQSEVKAEETSVGEKSEETVAEEKEETENDGEVDNNDTDDEGQAEPVDTDAEEKEEIKGDEEVDESYTEELTETNAEEKEEVKGEENEGEEIPSAENNSDESEGQDAKNLNENQGEPRETDNQEKTEIVGEEDEEEETPSAKNNTDETGEENVSNQDNEKEENAEPVQVPEEDEVDNETNEEDKGDAAEDAEDEQPAEDTEDQEPAENNEKTSKNPVNYIEKEKEIEAKEDNSNNAENVEDSEKNDEEEAEENEGESQPDDPLDPKEDERDDLAKENSPEITANEESTENQSENQSEKLKDDTEIDAINTENKNYNQSRNIDPEEQIETEEQLEKPSAEIIDDITEVSDAVTAKVKDIQTAGILTIPEGDGNNG